MTDREVLRQVTELFIGRPKARRRSPNRCLGCGKVSRHIFCDSTYALYKAKTS